MRRGDVELPLRDPDERCVNVSGIDTELTVLCRLSRWRPESSWSEETAPPRSGNGRVRRAMQRAGDGQAVLLSPQHWSTFDTVSTRRHIRL
jgi:hypothetical protein